MYQHRVDFEPEIESKKRKCKLFRKLHSLFNDAVAFDGQQAFALNRIDEMVNTKNFPKKIIFQKTLLS